VQATQLQHDEEQEEDDRANRDEQVLQVLSETYRSQGKQVSGSRQSSVDSHQSDRLTDEGRLTDDWGLMTGDYEIGQ
jgi:hypothetical protein